MNINQSKLDFFVILISLFCLSIIFLPFKAYPLPNSFVTLCLIFFSVFCFLIWHKFSIHQEYSHIEEEFNLSYFFLVLITITFINIFIYIPISLIHFDTGTDLTISFGTDRIWWPRWAEYQNRPLSGVGSYLALLISEKSLDGFLIVNVISRILTALTIIFLCNLLCARDRILGFLSGIFYSINHGDISQFNLWSIYYNISVLFVFLSIYLFIYSYKFNNRLILGFSCLCLGFSLLQYEHGYFIAAPIPFLIFYLYGYGTRLALWSFAWWGTLGVLSMRLIIFMKTRSNYQTDLFATSNFPGTVKDFFSMIISNAAIQFKPILNMGIYLFDIFFYPSQGFFLLLSLSIFIFIILYKLSIEQERPRLINPCLILVVGFCISILGVMVYIGLPFPVHDSDYAANPTMRYQYFSSVGHALFWAAIAYLLTFSFSDKKIRLVTISIISGLFCTGAIVSSYNYQLSGGALNSYFNYEKSIETYKEIRSVLPPLGKDDLIFLEISDELNSPLGWNYTALHYSCRVFGSPLQIGQSNEKNELLVRPWGHGKSIKERGPTCKTIHYLEYSKEKGVKFIKTVHQTVSPDLPSCGTMCLVSPLAQSPGEELPFIKFNYLGIFNFLNK